MRTGPPVFPDHPDQHGLATRAQLLMAGFTRSAVRNAARRDWQQVRPGVFAPHRGPLEPEVRLAGAALWAGPAAVLSGTIALRQHGLTGARTDEALFLVPTTHRSRQEGRVRTVRTGRPVRVALHAGCIAVTNVERALVDAAIYQGGADLTALTIAALQRRLTTSDRLEAELAAAPRRGTRPVRQGLATFVRGAWSMPEGALADLVEDDPDLPPMLLNVPLLTTDGACLIGTPDGFFPAAGVAVQVHSRQFHSGYDDEGTDLWSLTVEGDGAYPEHDVICLGVTPWSIHRRPEATLARIRTVVLRNVGRAYGPVRVGDEVVGSVGETG